MTNVASIKFDGHELVGSIRVRNPATIELMDEEKQWMWAHGLMNSEWNHGEQGHAAIERIIKRSSLAVDRIEVMQEAGEVSTVIEGNDALSAAYYLLRSDEVRVGEYSL